jgi:hypothetical protein
MHAFKFLPDNYEAPRSGGQYMKIQKGENKIRILSEPIIGWEDWNIDKKPVRFEYANKPLSPLVSDKPVKHFWAMIVWNYSEEKIQILQITQSGIRKGIETLCNDSDWGAPYFYDIKIIKTGGEDPKSIKYQVNPLPHKPTPPHIAQAFKDNPCFLEALFVNEDPFASHWGKKTPGIFGEKPQESPEKTTKMFISDLQVKELESIFAKCDASYVKSVKDTLAKDPMNVQNITQLPVDLYEKIKTAALKKSIVPKSNSNDVDWIK